MTPQLERTIGTVYGESMRDSGITLPNARYITGSNFVSSLRDNGVRATRQEIFKELELNLGYGIHDNIITWVQTFKWVGTKNGQADPQRTTYTFNPWKEITGRDPSVRLLPYILGIGVLIYDNPQEGIERLKALYKSFAQLPEELQNKFLHELQTDPCFIERKMEYPLDLSDFSANMLDVILQIKKTTPEDQQKDISTVLRLLTYHNVCVSKDYIVGRQIKELLDWDTSKTPTQWKSGHLDDVVLAKEKIEELNEMFLAKH